MKSTLNKIALLLAVSCIVLSCSKTEDFLVDFKYDYFPLDSGHTVIYDVDSINVNKFNNRIDTFSFQIMEVVGDTFFDLEGDLAHEIYRYKRNDPNDNWGPRRVWHAKLVTSATERTLQKVEENLRFIKLTFPPRLSSSWHGNRFFTLPDELESIDDENLASYKGPNDEPWEYHYTEIDVPATFNGLSFDSTLTVLHYNDSTLLNKTYSTEVYAKNIGLIYKEHVWLHYQPSVTIPPGLSWNNPLKWNEDGFILRMVINSYQN